MPSLALISPTFYFYAHIMLILEAYPDYHGGKPNPTHCLLPKFSPPQDPIKAQMWTQSRRAAFLLVPKKGHRVNVDRYRVKNQIKLLQPYV